MVTLERQDIVPTLERGNDKTKVPSEVDKRTIAQGHHHFQNISFYIFYNILLPSLCFLSFRSIEKVHLESQQFLRRF